MSKIREKESLECGRMHIWALKTQKLPGPLSGPWTPAANCSLCSHDSASLTRLCFATSATFGLRTWGPPLTKSWIRTWKWTVILRGCKKLKLKTHCDKIHSCRYPRYACSKGRWLGASISSCTELLLSSFTSIVQLEVQFPYIRWCVNYFIIVEIT